MNRHHSIAVALVMLILPALLWATKLPEFTYEKFSLPNGLQVILHEDHSQPTVSVNIYYHVGSKNEKPGRTGFAHLFEHIMFGDTEHRKGSYFQEFEKIGGRVNGMTGDDATEYYDDVPSQYLETTLWAESERMGYLIGGLTQEKLDIQRDVVKNERRQRLENQPYAKVVDLLPGAVFPAGHPYSHITMGSMEDLSAASLDDVKEFFRTYYVPNNASLCIVGDFDSAPTRSLVEKYFEPIPAGLPLDRMRTWQPTIEHRKILRTEDRVEFARVYYRWITPALLAPDDAELDILSDILSDGINSRLVKRLFYDLKISTSAWSVQASQEICSCFQIVGDAVAGVSSDLLERAIDQVIREVQEKGVTAAEVKRAQTSRIAEFTRSIEEGGCSNLAGRLNEYNCFFGDPSLAAKSQERYAHVTPADVQRVARQYLDLDHCAIVEVVPQGDFTHADSTAVDRSILPVPAPERNFSVPQIQEATLSNGLRLMLIEKHDLPLIKADIAVHGGWADDPPQQTGLAQVTGGMVWAGTARHSVTEISDMIRDLGGQIDMIADHEISGLSFNTMTDNFDPVLDLVSDMIMHPAFKADELERMRMVYLNVLEDATREPKTVAMRAFFTGFYGTGHPYSISDYDSPGTIKFIKDLKREDVESFYNTYYRPNNATVMLVGDITLAEAQRKFEKAFKSWKPGLVPEAKVAAPPAPTGTRVVIIDKPDAPQSSLIVGTAGPSRADSDYIACNIVHALVGGLFTSRLNMNLREAHGYTYSAHTALYPERTLGVYLAAADVQTSVTDSALSAIVQELRAVGHERPISDAELKQGKDYIRRVYPQEYRDFNGLEKKMRLIYANGLSSDEWQTYLQRLDAVDANDVKHVAAEHLNANNLLIVVVGDRQKIEPGIKALNLGDITIIEAEDLF